MKRALAAIPSYGVGIGLRPEIADETLKHRAELDVLEIVSENFITSNGDVPPLLERFRTDFPLIPHGIKLSIGSALPLDHAFLAQLRRIVELTRATYYSDHFTLAHLGIEADTDHLTPLWFTREMLDHVCARVQAVQDYMGVPLVLENITAPFVINEADFEEPEFVTQVCARTGCGLLLDLTNLHINAYNHKYKAQDLLMQYPLDALVQVHLAGGRIASDYFYDSHSEPIRGPNEPVWELFEDTLKFAIPKTVIIERDANFGTDFEFEFLHDVRRAKTMWQAATIAGHGD